MRPVPYLIMSMFLCLLPAFTNAESDGSRNADYIASTENGVRERLDNPKGARFRDAQVYQGSGSPVVCGQVNSKDDKGNYTGFRGFMAAGMEIILESDMRGDVVSTPEFEQSWKQLCHN